MIIMKDDLISRQDAIDAHCELCPDKGKCNHVDLCPDVEVFNLLPFVQPEDKCGECDAWIGDAKCTNAR